MLAWSHPAITGWKENSFAVQNERYRYIRYSDGSEELYDHQIDPNEWTNLAKDPDRASIKKRLEDDVLRMSGIGPRQALPAPDNGNAAQAQRHAGETDLQVKVDWPTAK